MPNEKETAGLSPKEQYEARKAERQKRREAEDLLGSYDKHAAVEDIMDRLVTAVERIADSLEQSR